MCASLNAQQTAQTDLSSFTTAEKDSVQLALIVLENNADVVMNDSFAATDLMLADTATTELYNWVDVVGLANCRYLAPEEYVYDRAAVTFSNTLTIPEFTIADYTPIECIAAQSNVVFDYEAYLYAQRLRTIAAMITQRFTPQKQELAVHHPSSGSHAGILPPETRIAVPESRKRPKNNPRA
ncbi:MAG: hypothetical protein IM638_04595 [Bacteroidetes bacterium]|nr:hypothetical protein [Bacteroidota bacterium]